MLGHRGCRLGITYPEIYEMQARAILEAALNVEKGGGKPVAARNHDPAGRLQDRARYAEDRIAAVADAVRAERGKSPPYPDRNDDRAAARRAYARARSRRSAEFFSFGTNDLTQTTLGVSRDDAGTFLSEYLTKGLIARDPFVSIDVDGVGELVRIAVERGRASRKNIKLGICGEHGGDPDSIRFCHELGT